MRKQAHLAVALAVGLGLALTVVTGGHGHAEAATRRAAQAARKGSKAKKARKGRKAKKIDSAEPGAPVAEAQERTAPAQFAWTARTTAVDMDVRADSKRDEAIAKLRKLLPSVSDGPQKAELIFRLSEMYWAKSRFLHIRAMQAWDAALDAWHRAGARGTEPTFEQMPDLDQSRLYRREALGLYERILAKYPDYHRKDEVLYNLGSSLYDAGEKKKGVAKYWKLIKQYPSSDFAPDAWLQLGEHFFNANKLTHAIKAYSKAASTKKPRIYSYALYKLAWCDYNLQEYKDALGKFRKVVDYAKAQAAQSARGTGGDAAMAERDRIQLLEESLSDMVRAYSHLDAVQDAFAYYTRELGKQNAYSYLHRLGKLYDQEGKYELEIDVLEQLNQQYPYAPQAPQNQTAVMNGFAQLNQTDRVRKEARRLIELYSPNGIWAQRNAGDQKVLEGAFEVVESALAGLVTEQHRAAQATKLVETYKLARDLYEDYLEKFTATLNSYKFRFFYAEILFELKEFGKAAEQYTRVVEENRKGEYAKPAAYTAVLSWEKVASGVKETLGTKIYEGKRGKRKGTLQRLERIETLKKGETYEETPLTPAESKLADACDRFVEVAPQDPEVVKVKFKSARLYYIHNHFEEAAQRFGEIIDKWPKDGLARIGAESIVQSFNVRKDWTRLNQWSRAFRDNALLMADQKFRQTIDEFVEGASFNEIHFVYEPKGDPRDIADRYAAFVKEFPQSKYVLVALYNAIVNYDKCNLLERSMEMADAVLSHYRTFKISAKDLEQSKKEGSQLPSPEEIREKVLFLNASFYERLALFERSAVEYEAYAKEFSKGTKRADALFNAGLFREGLGDYDAAITNFKTYIKDYPDQKDTADIAWRIGTILEQKKDYGSVQSYFSQYAKTYGKHEPARQLCADYKVVEAVLAQGKGRDAKAGYQALLDGYGKLSAADKQKPCPLKAAASSAFRLIEPDYEEYLKISLVGKEKVVADNLTKKLETVDKLQKRYTDVLGIGEGDYGIAALYRIGKIYRHLAEAIFSSPCPRRLDEDQCGIYQAMLQEKAFPLEEKSIEAYDKALKKAYELGLYNEWLAKTQDALKTYEPGRFPEIQTYDLIASETVSEIPSLLEVAQ